MATQTQTQSQKAARTYVLTGTLLEACSCRTLCRCWIGEDPDNGACDAFNAYHIDKGEINGIDVSGLTYVQVVKIPGNVLVPKSWTRVTSFSLGLSAAPIICSNRAMGKSARRWDSAPSVMSLPVSCFTCSASVPASATTWKIKL